MASRDPEVATTSHTASVFQEFDKAESEIDSHFDWLKQQLEEKRLALKRKLREKRAEFEELETGRVGQIKEIETMKQQLLSVGVKFNKINVLREETLKNLDANLENLKTSIKLNIFFQSLKERSKEVIDLIDLMFVGCDYKDKVLPIKCIDIDSIQTSMQDILATEKEGKPSPVYPVYPVYPSFSTLLGSEEPNKVEQKTDTKVNEKEEEKEMELRLGKIAINPESGHIIVLNRKSNYVLVFNEDVHVIKCLKFTHPMDLSIDLKNNSLFVSDNGDNLLKFKLGTYELLKEKKMEEAEEAENGNLSIDTHDGEVYVCGMTKMSNNIHVFDSDLEFIKSIQTSSLLCFQIYCYETAIFLQSIGQAGLAMYSYNGEFIRNVPLPYMFILFEMLQNNNPLLESLESLPYSFCMDQNGLILQANTFNHCINILTLTGEVVHTIEIEPEEEGEKVFPMGVAVTNDNRIIVSVHGSKFPLRIF